MQVIYARISKDELNHDNQIHALVSKFPDAEIIKETISGNAKVKPILQALLERLQRGDTIAIYGLDRISRRGGEAIVLLRALLDRGILVFSLRENFDFTSAVGEYMSGQMLLFAQLERRLISERTKASLKRLKDEGKVLGRPNSIPATIKAKVLELRKEGKTIKEINVLTSVSTGRICQLLKVV